MDPKVNARQLEVLQWVADGCQEGRWPAADYTHRTSAVALKNRGLVTVKGHGPTWTASVTDAGAYYIEHGTYPPGHSDVVVVREPRRASAAHDPVELGAGATKSLDEANALIEKLQQEKSRSVTIADPSESTRAHYRRILHACRQHHLTPVGHELRFTGRDAGDIVIALSDGSDKETSDWDMIRTRARKVTTNVTALRTALDSTPSVIDVTDDLRPRAVEFATLLASELRAHDLKLGVNIKLKTPKLFLQTESARRDVRLEEVLKEVPHVRTNEEDREARRSPWKTFPKVDQVPSGLLRITVARDGWNGSTGRHNFDEWVDKPKTPLEKQVRVIARAIKAGVVDDVDTRQRGVQARAEAHEKWERQQAQERGAWEEVRARARAKAVEQLREGTFIDTFDAWRGAQELRAFATELEAAVAADHELGERPRFHEWIEWARQRADEMDPIVNLKQLDDRVLDVKPSADDLRPFMEGWDPSAPHKDYGLISYGGQPNTPQAPQPKPWHPGMRGKPSWWRH